MTPHPDRDALAARILDRVDELVTSFNGSIFRFAKPKYSKTVDLFAGMGARHANGRWLIKGGRLAVYTSLVPETALAEALAANRYYGFPDDRSAPLVFVTAEVRLAKVIDFREGAIRQRLRMAKDTIVGTDWRAENRAGREAITQTWGWALHEAGVEGFLCPSASDEGGENLIIFPENIGRKASLRVLSEVKWPR
jgi:RES domain-containing protein